MPPKEAHQKIREQYPDALLSSNYLLFTDGSGWTDPYGGCASLAIGMRPENFLKYTMKAAFGTDVERMEFEGLLDGLQSIIVASKRADDYIRRMRPRVAWITDRESLALSVWRPAGPRQPSFYGRKASPDLWARFAYYEELFEIVPLCEERNTHASHALVDELASELRVLMKEWVIIRSNDNKTPNHVDPRVHPQRAAASRTLPDLSHIGQPLA